MKRHQMPLHLRNECSHRWVYCEYCSVEIVFKDKQVRLFIIFFRRKSANPRICPVKFIACGHRKEQTITTKAGARNFHMGGWKGEWMRASKDKLFLPLLIYIKQGTYSKFCFTEHFCHLKFRSRRIILYSLVAHNNVTLVVDVTLVALKAKKANSKLRLLPWTVDA